MKANFEGALNEEPRLGAARKLKGKEEALLETTACSKPPDGRACRTLELLAGEFVTLNEHEELSRKTVRRDEHSRSLYGGKSVERREVVVSPRLGVFANPRELASRQILFLTRRRRRVQQRLQLVHGVAEPGPISLS